MKNIIKILIYSFLAFSLQDSIRAQSSLVTFSPSSLTLINVASRCGYNYGNWTSYYMRYNDSSYYCIMNYVVVATRDSRSYHAPVNLRISDTSELLSANPEIDFQWQFLLPSYENVVSEIRMIPIKKDIFVLAYTIFDDFRSDYFLCTHLISLYDFLSGYNTIVSHEISSVKQCSNLIEMVYEPDVNTMIILLNGSEKSELYHVDPITATSTIASKLDYPNGLLHSLDVIQQYFSYNADKYMAMGDSVLFFQDISNGINFDYSCLQISPVKYFLVDPPSIDLFLDPLERYSDQKTYAQISKSPIYFEGVKTCDITENKNTK